MLLIAAAWSPALAANCRRLAPEGEYVAAMLEKDGRQERRVAFVLGNGDYGADIDDLRNPVRDAVAIAERLQALGFEVYLSQNAAKAETLSCVEQTASAMEGAAIGLLYYAGHGVQIQDANYIVATDTRLDISTLSGLVPVAPIVRRFQTAADATIAMLDACRTTPWSEPSGGETSRTLQRGLAQVAADDGGGTGAAGLLVAFATSPNATASDGIGEHSPFTHALLQHVGAPGYPVDRMLAAVASSVGEATNWSQTPWALSSLTEPLFLNGRKSVEELAAESANLASRSRSLSNRGDFTGAIKAALEGLPLHLSEAELRRSFGPAHDALYDAMRRRPVRTSLAGHIEATLSADGRYVAAAVLAGDAPDRRVTITEASSGREIAVVGRGGDHHGVGGDPGSVRAWSISPDSTTLATLATDGEVELWELATGRLVAAWPTRQEGGTAAAMAGESQNASLRYTPNGEGIVTCRGRVRGPIPRDAESVPSDEIKLWEASSGRLLHSYSIDIDRRPEPERVQQREASHYSTNIEEHANGVAARALRDAAVQLDSTVWFPRVAADGSVLAATTALPGSSLRYAGQRPHRILLWDLVSSHRLPDLLGAASFVGSYGFDQSGARLAALSGGGVWVWDVKTGHVLRHWNMEGVVSDFSFRPDGNVVAMKTESGWLYYDVVGGGRIVAPPIEETVATAVLVGLAGDVLGFATPAADHGYWRRGRVGPALLAEALALLDEADQDWIRARRLRYWPMSDAVARTLDSSN